ncbi:hypothetical protein [Mycobacterium palustre]|uniref:Tyrosine protein kinase n=1 Tax=Mycobacterium palustre TaxID=153971 RepID=A0A1X1ZIU4_9MYCO|nr:hypothetical protein [Mycobacterium palustre]MCV7102804.1 tyrosine protein kinase [Mycobacterium palustre]ORW23294.1 hypothetical protein AWC19_12110 [Mycobacterium palustre]
MPLGAHPPEIDLYYFTPPEGQHWEPHRIHTNYFGLTVPEARLGAYIYLRCHPEFRLCHGGVVVFDDFDAVDPLDSVWCDYEISMPWPTIGDRSVSTANGLRFDIVDPGRVIRIRYGQSDDLTHLDVTATAVTPLIARPYIMPGEEQHHDVDRSQGGIEQMMRYIGQITVRGVRHAVDCYDLRDRSWNQIRVERRGAVRVPPICLTPMRFGDDLMLNHIGFEAPDSEPAWKGLYDLPDDYRKPIFGWVYTAGDPAARSITRVTRNVLAYHPFNHMPTRQELQIEDESGRTHRFSGEALSVGVIPTWPNATFRDSVYRWHDERGRVCYSATQEMWFDDYQRLMKQRSARARSTRSA